MVTDGAVTGTEMVIGTAIMMVIITGCGEEIIITVTITTPFIMDTVAQSEVREAWHAKLITNRSAKGTKPALLPKGAGQP